MDLTTPIYLRSVSTRALPPGYVGALPAMRGIGAFDFAQPVTILVGENGSGKSTVIETLAVGMGLQAAGGSENFRLGTDEGDRARQAVYFRMNRGPFYPDTCYFLRAESFFNVATEVDRLSKIGPPLTSHGTRSLHEQSHGESFLALVRHRFRPGGLYLLDEPESALSPMRQLALLRRMKDLVRDRCQFIMATHSPILMAYPGAAIYDLTPEGPQRIAYDEIEHVRVTREFMRRPDRLLEELFAEPDGPPEAPGPEGAGGAGAASSGGAERAAEDPAWERSEGGGMGWRAEQRRAREEAAAKALAREEGEVDPEERTDAENEALARKEKQARLKWYERPEDDPA